MKKIGKLFLVGMMTFIGMMLSMKVQAADMPANPVDKPGYTLDYADEFNGDSLDKSKWTDYYLPHWSKNPENAKANYRFENGCLVEYITKDHLRLCLSIKVGYIILVEQWIIRIEILGMDIKPSMDISKYGRN